MAQLETDRLIEMLRDPNVESRDVAAAAGVPREEAARAARLVLGIAKAKPEEVATLPAPLAVAACRVALGASRTDVLAALAGHAGKEVAKEAKRALHILRTRGVAIPEPPRPAPAASAAAPEPPLAAYATTIDARGERAVWLPRTIPGKGVEVGQAVLSDERGLLELQIGVVGRKEWRALVKDLVERRAAMGVREIERGRAAALVAAAGSRRGVPRPSPRRGAGRARGVGGAARPAAPRELARGRGVPARGRGQARRDRRLAAVRGRRAARRSDGAHGRGRGGPLPRRRPPGAPLRTPLLGGGASPRRRRHGPRALGGGRGSCPRCRNAGAQRSVRTPARREGVPGRARSARRGDRTTRSWLADRGAEVIRAVRLRSSRERARARARARARTSRARARARSRARILQAAMARAALTAGGTSDRSARCPAPLPRWTS